MGWGYPGGEGTRVPPWRGCQAHARGATHVSAFRPWVSEVAFLPGGAAVPGQPLNMGWGHTHVRLSHPGVLPSPGLPADPVLTRGPLSPGLPGRPASPCGTEGMKGVGDTGGTRGGQCPIRTLTHRGAFVTFLSTLALRRRSAAAAGGQKDKSPTSPPHNLPQIGAMAPPQCPPPKPPAPRTSLPRSPVCPGVPARPGSPFSPGSPGSP